MSCSHDIRSSLRGSPVAFIFGGQSSSLWADPSHAWVEFWRSGGWYKRDGRMGGSGTEKLIYKLLGCVMMIWKWMEHMKHRWAYSIMMLWWWWEDRVIPFTRGLKICGRKWLAWCLLLFKRMVESLVFVQFYIWSYIGPFWTAGILMMVMQLCSFSHPVLFYSGLTGTLPETKMTPENGWLEDYFPFGNGLFLEAILVSGRVLLFVHSICPVP